MFPVSACIVTCGGGPTVSDVHHAPGGHEGQTAAPTCRRIHHQARINRGNPTKDLGGCGLSGGFGTPGSPGSSAQAKSSGINPAKGINLPLGGRGADRPSHQPVEWTRGLAGRFRGRVRPLRRAVPLDAEEVAAGLRPAISPVRRNPLPNGGEGG